MQPNLTSRTLLALVALGSMLQAQTPTPKTTKTTKTTIPTPVAGPTIRCPVGGLTRENVALVQSTLTALNAETYVCDPCKVETASPGACTKCSTALRVAERPLLASATVAPDNASLMLALHPQRRTSLAAIEAAMTRHAVTIDNRTMTLPGRIILVIDGGCADQIATVQKALGEAKLFEELGAQFDTATSKIRLTARSLPTPPTRAALIEILEKHKLRLADVLFESTVE